MDCNAVMLVCITCGLLAQYSLVLSEEVTNLGRSKAENLNLSQVSKLFKRQLQQRDDNLMVDVRNMNWFEEATADRKKRHAQSGFSFNFQKIPTNKENTMAYEAKNEPKTIKFFNDNKKVETRSYSDDDLNKVIKTLEKLLEKSHSLKGVGAAKSAHKTDGDWEGDSKLETEYDFLHDNRGNAVRRKRDKVNLEQEGVGLQVGLNGDVSAPRAHVQARRSARLEREPMNRALDPNYNIDQFLEPLVRRRRLAALGSGQET